MKTNSISAEQQVSKASKHKTAEQPSIIKETNATSLQDSKQTNKQTQQTNTTNFNHCEQQHSGVYYLEQFVRCFSSERRGSRQHLEHEHSERPVVHRHAVAAPADDLARNVPANTTQTHNQTNTRDREMREKRNDRELY
jgi:hypothetical protein